MYGMFSISLSRYEHANSALTVFDLIANPKTRFRPFFNSRTYFSQQIRNENCLAIPIQVKALSFHFNYNTLLSLIINSQTSPIYLEKAFVFSRNSLGLHKWRIDLVECSLRTFVIFLISVFLTFLLKYRMF